MPPIGDEDTCYNALRNLTDLDGLKDEDLQRIVNAVENIKAASEKDGFSYQERMMRELEKIKAETLNQRIEKVTGALRHRANIERVSDPIFNERPLEAVMSLLNQVQTTAKGAVNSIANRQDYMRETNSSMYYQALRGLGEDALNVMKTGALDREIYIEMERLQNMNSKLPDTKNKMAKKIAEVQVKINDILKMDIERGVGHKIGDVQSYITKQVHDRSKVRGDGSKEAMKNWVEAILPYLDQDKTFGAKFAGDEAAMRKQLEESWSHIVYGDKSFEANRRSLHFRDAEQAYLYNLEFGNKSLYEATLARIADNARIVAQMDVLGPDPQRGLDRIISHLDKRYRNSNPQVWQDFQKVKYRIDNVMLGLTGFSSMPGDSLMADVGRFSRNLNNLTYLGNTGVRAMGGNIPVLALEIKSNQGLNVLETLNVALKGLVARIDPKLKNETMIKTGMAMHDFHFGIAAQFTDDISPGRVSRGVMKFLDMMSMPGAAREVQSQGVMGALQKPFFHLTGLSYINDVDRSTAARLLMGGVYERIGKSFDDLDPQFKANIERAGIDEPAWKLLQLAGDKLESNGMEVVSIEKLREINPKIVEQVMKEHKIGGDPRNYLRDVEIRYGTYLWSAGRIATTTPDLRTMSAIKGQYTEDQVLGQVRRLMGQFKSFSIFQSDIMTRFFTANPEDGARELADILRWKGSVGSLAAYASSASLFWYMGEQLIRLGQGRPLEDPRDPKTFGKALLKSGAIGIIADFVDAESGHGKDRTVWAYAAGPTFGRAISAGRIVGQALVGSDVRKETGSFLVNTIPGQNFFLTRRAMEPLLLDPIREMVDPNYAYRKQIQQMRLEMGQ